MIPARDEKLLERAHSSFISVVNYKDGEILHNYVYKKENLHGYRFPHRGGTKKQNSSIASTMRCLLYY